MSLSLTYLERQKSYGMDKLRWEEVEEEEEKIRLGDRSMIFGMWVHDHTAVCHVQ
jgi:hypothetical protein